MNVLAYAEKKMFGDYGSHFPSVLCCVYVYEVYAGLVCMCARCVQIEHNIYIYLYIYIFCPYISLFK